LGDGITGFGRPAVPGHGGGRIGRHAQAVQIKLRQGHLGLQVPRFRQRPPGFDRRFEIPGIVSFEAFGESLLVVFPGPTARGRQHDGAGQQNHRKSAGPIRHGIRGRPL
jgi:hypothetical protein